jgi:hypothetical protein
MVHSIVIHVLDVQSPGLLEFLKGIETKTVFGVGMDIRIEPEALYVDPHDEKALQGIEAAVRTTDVHQEFHGPVMVFPENRE